MRADVDYQQTDYLVIGSGVAGLRAALELVKAGSVVALAKADTGESNTEYAQGGVAVALSDDDEVECHFVDTVSAGDGHCDENAVKVLVSEGPARISELIEWGAAFDQEGNKLAFTGEGAHSRRRVIHAHGDSTGREIVRALRQRAQMESGLRLVPHTFIIDLLVENDRCRGVLSLDRASSRLCVWQARAVILASGGLGHVYRDTTNPDIATGDGFAMAYRAGARLCDMEFVQFHPTALALPGVPRFLITEAIRGEGGYLRNQRGERFMERYHERAELAPRDVVSRAIVQEIQSTSQSEIYLDLSHLRPDFVRRRFPRVYQTCLGYGLDITRDRVPVHPAAHYMMGGIETDLYGRTNIKNLFAAGEVACTGVHGANRLASNSLLEGLVFGARAGQGALSVESRADSPADPIDLNSFLARPAAAEVAAERLSLQKIMRNFAGVLRSGDGLREAAKALGSMPTSQLDGGWDSTALENANLLTVARLITQAAEVRKESRGSHYRMDYPSRDDETWRKRIVLCRTAEPSFKPLLDADRP
ncbi:MAG: L-aspartate oxidase [Acidobacteria bacterium]|nr:L-aspartate oxidase [Acidobacteriota bacterium]MBI3655833.1 L-aspartate oxidase [Acidobacteriota bacterium]